MAASSWRGHPQIPRDRGRYRLNDPVDGGIILDAMAFQIPPFRGESRDVGIGAPRPDPREQRRTPVQRRQMQWDVKTHRLISEHPIGEKTPGEAVCTLLNHPGARHMDNVEGQRVLHLQQAEPENQGE